MPRMFLQPSLLLPFFFLNLLVQDAKTKITNDKGKPIISFLGSVEQIWPMGKILTFKVKEMFIWIKNIICVVKKKNHILSVNLTSIMYVSSQNIVWDWSLGSDLECA